MMRLTPEQQQQVQKAKESGEKRVMLKFTPEQKAEWKAAMEQELAGKDENLAHFRNIKAAAERPGFFGDLRRAIILSRQPVQQLANAIGVDWRLLSDFQAGEAELPPASLERLIDVLALRLVKEIPRCGLG